MKENLKSFLIFLLITGIFLFPGFLGKIDTPTNIRDSLTYPWRYYSIDKKVKTIKLWELRNNKTPVDIKILPKTVSKLEAPLNLYNLSAKSLPPPQKSRYYINFKYQINSKKSNDLILNVQLIDKQSNKILTPNFSIKPITVSANEKERNVSWYRIHANLNPFINSLLPTHYLRITIQNNDTKNEGELLIKELELNCEDYSNIPGIYNYYNKNVIEQFKPFGEFFSNSVRNLKLPFWNNYIFGGTEFLSEPQIGYLNPFYLLIYFIFDHFTAHLLITFLSFTLCGFGAFLLTKHWGFSYPAALFTGIIYMFHPFNVTRSSYEYMPMISSILPFLLLSYELNLKAFKVININLAICSLLLGLLFLSGHLQYVEYTIILFALFIIFQLFTSKENTSKTMLSTFLIFLFGLMIGAIVLIPFPHLLHNSFRVSIPDVFLKENSVSLKSFIGLLLPFYKGRPVLNLSGFLSNYIIYKNDFWRNYVYFGILPFLFSIIALKLVFKEKLPTFFFLALVLSLFIATGSPLFFLVKDYIPGFKVMQNYKALQIFSFCVPFIAGIGFQSFIDLSKKLKPNIKTLLLSLVIIITTIDLLYFSSSFITWQNKDSYKPIPENSSLEFLLHEKKKSIEPFRVHPIVLYEQSADFPNNEVIEPDSLLPYKIETITGYSSFIPTDLYNLLVYIKTKDSKNLYKKEFTNIFSNLNRPYPINQFNDNLLDLLNVKYFISTNDVELQSPSLKKVYSGDTVIYENENCFPRAFFVNDYELIKSPRDTIVKLGSKKFNPNEKVILMSLSVNYPERKTDIKLDFNIAWVKYENENIILKVNTNQAGFFILGNNLNDNWKVKVNDKESVHVQANLVQRAVYLPKEGNYLIEFYYYPKLYLIGLLISCIAMIILLLLVLYIKLSKRA